MARGDVVSQEAEVPAGAELTYQPAAGVEVLIREVGSSEWLCTVPDRYPAITVFLGDAIFRDQHKPEAPLHLFVTNSLYLRIRNQSTTSERLAFCGIQTK